MDFPAPAPSGDSDVDDPDAIIVKADEVDESGADISAISPSESTSESDFNARIEKRRKSDAQASSPKILANAVPSPPRPLPRPILRRDGSAPLPPQQPPPPAPEMPKDDGADKPTDSLTLSQLKKLVGDLPKIEPTAYAYDYQETRSFPEELQEWFVYNDEESLMLLRAKEDFEEKWAENIGTGLVENEEVITWYEATDEDRYGFVEDIMKDVSGSHINERVKALECLSYISLGTWGDTVGVSKKNDDGRQDPPESAQADGHDASDAAEAYPQFQLEWIFKGVEVLMKMGVVEEVTLVLKRLWESEQDAGEEADLSEEQLSELKLMRQLEANHALTVLYLIVESSRDRSKHDDSTGKDPRRIISDVRPHLLQLLTRFLGRLRWEDPADPSSIPRHKMLLLFWKSLLLLFGNNEALEESKHALKASSDSKPGAGDHEHERITASPLDYHLFRQEITSKYPTYSPPPPLVPIEPENNTMLPPLPNHHSRQTSHDNLQNLTNGTSAPAGSIFNQPVHIATPAPSPPPSPAIAGGKGAKKQNYQTNQNFPFLYPPLDGTPDPKATDTQQKPLDTRWQGNNVPASILEAGRLFASRMRMSRSLRQLWDARERYIKEERGWGELDLDADHLEDSDESDAERLHHEGDDSLPDSPECVEKRAWRKAQESSLRREPETTNADVQSRLDAVDEYYRGALPDLQSLVIVLWKELFQNVSALVAGIGSSVPNSGDEGGDGAMKRKTNANSSASLNALANGHVENGDTADLAIENLNDVRLREIASKAVSGTLLTLLKWFKLSHILKYEYLAQLLLDANYMPLILKFFAHQDIDKAVEQKNDREDLEFFAFCHRHSKNTPNSPSQPELSPSDSDSSDDAAPPPIRKHRRMESSQAPPHTPPEPPLLKLPEVDELGFPAAGSTLPQTPLTNYAPRFFLTNINLLRLLQKMTKRKAHRALLLVQYKSSTILRKALKIPQPDLRLYTLKLFKSQVPYCGRKWRQTNMRVITAIYLHCRPELRDEWLCGGDVDGVVEEAVPVEQAGRALVHWWHLRTYRDVMEGTAGMKREKDAYDFFARELEKMGWGMGEFREVGGEAEISGDGGQGQSAADLDAGPVRMEGWA